MPLNPITKARLLKALLLLVLLGVGLFLLKIQKPGQPIEPPAPTQEEITAERITVQGTYVECIPLHDNFSKKECVHGVKATEGSYYALDFNLMSQTVPNFKEGDLFTASGVFTPTEMLNSDYMYETVGRGILSVTDLTLDTVPSAIPSKPVKPTPGKESATGPCYIGGCSAQICSGEKDMASTCEYRESYACYKTAKCERQVNTGKCGWTPSAELNSCLSR
ncbi:MAG: hypothetical protein V4576_00990 [Patescibacteria group bacterium]